MNNLFNHSIQLFKMKRFKYIVLFTIVFLIPLIFIGCIHFNKAISKVNVFMYTSFEVTVTNNSSTLDIVKDTQLFKQTDATSSLEYMLLRNLFSQFEDISYEQKITTKETIPYDRSLLPEDNSIALSIHANYESSERKTYTIVIDVSKEQLFIDDSVFLSSLGNEAFSKFMDSNLLNADIDESSIPTLQVTIANTPIPTSQTIQWEYHFYGERFIERDITPLNIDALTTTLLTEQSALQMTWSGATPSSGQISVIKQPSQRNNSTNVENNKPIINTFDLMQAGPITYQLPSESGYYLIEILSTWLPSDSKDYGTSTTRFYLDIKYPESFSLRNTYIEPGDLIVIEAINLNDKDNYSIKTNLTTSKLSFTPSGTNNYLFVPLMSKYVPGDYYLTIKNNLSDTVVSDFAITVSDKAFEIQHLTTSTTTASLQNQANNDQLVEALNRARQNPSQEKLWTGNFIQPCGGRISTEYGVIRYTNGSETGSRHSGIDFANPTGTPALATQNGYIRLAEFLNITGNTLVIDHGLGIYSQYYHLDSFDVKVGDYIEAGTVVGKIGTTGFSTGSHLHFCMYYNGIYLNPWKFFDNAPF